MNLLGIIILVVLGLIVLAAPRRWALLAMVAGVLYLTQSQQLIIFGFHLWAMRFLELAGFVRVASRREFSFSGLNKIDRAFLWLYGYTTVVFLLRSTTGQTDEIGKAVDAFLCYSTFRGLLSGMEDFRRFLRDFPLLLTPYTLLVLIESLTGHNLFSALGGEAGGGVWVRHGWPRCFGSFRQPDTLGMFAASFIPLYIGLSFAPTGRKRALTAICLCVIIAAAANSGGAAGAVIVGFACWGFWCYRTKMRKVRWGIVTMITALALVMKAPVWFILSHFSGVTGGNAFHRSYLIDSAYRHLNQWWLDGMPIADTVDWFPYYLPITGGADITNQFISFGLQAGLGAIVLFIFVLVRSFSNLGKALAAVRFQNQETSDNEFLLWGLGVTLFVHITNWFDITYFDQIYVVWFMQLAAISTLSQAYLAHPATVPVEEDVLEPEVEAPQPTAGFGQSGAPETFSS
jgi:hypothetical protein